MPSLAKMLNEAAKEVGERARVAAERGQYQKARAYRALAVELAWLQRDAIELEAQP